MDDELKRHIAELEGKVRELEARWAAIPWDAMGHISDISLRWIELRWLPGLANKKAIEHFANWFAANRDGKF